MMIFLQKAYLVFLTYQFFGVRGSLSQDLTGNCTFDQNALCNWHNEKHNDHFDWQLWQGSTPSNNTGPNSDHSGTGLYIYIETSKPRKYNEKARLNSPWMRGAQRMTFFYSMYGSTVESLSVYVRINGSEYRIWSRYGNHLPSNWIKGCVALKYSGTYQVIIEGVAGVTYTSNIAVDDFFFSTNLTCVSVGTPTTPEIFEENCTFDDSYCGWRNLITPPNDQITWNRKRPGNLSQGTGPSGDHTGGGKYIYIEASNPAKVNRSAQLLSPLIRGPKCLSFYYHVYRHGIGNLDVSLQIRDQPGAYLLWRKSGEQSDQWMKASVDIGYTGECQVLLRSTIGRNYTGGIAVDDVTLTDGLCKDDSDLQSNLLGNCNFDVHTCFWRNDFNFKWTLRRYSSPNKFTGPNTDHTSGNGMYLYIETSSPRNPGDTARLESPWMRGPQCMTFYYHMYGSTMSCVIIYIKFQATNRLKPVWLKSEDRGDRWIKGRININETTNYQIIVDGVRGSSHLGDAALDDFVFERGACQQTGGTTYYVSSYKGKDFRISTQPFDHSLYSEEFRFTLEHPRGHPKEKPFFVYPGAFSRQTFVSSKLDLSNYTNFPIDVVVLSKGEPPHNSRKIYVIDRSTYGPMISLDDCKTVNCCKGKLNFSFYAHNITESGNWSISGCEPGWFKASKSCYLFHFQSTPTWPSARNVCHRLGADLAVVNNAATMEILAKKRKEMKVDDLDLFIGLSTKLRWIWTDGKNVSNLFKMWGPNEPNGDGSCGSLLNAVGWNLNWLGYGWRWNDQNCMARKGYICEQPLAVPLPVALFSLSGTNGTVDMSPNGATKAVSNNIIFAAGPFGNPNGSFFFGGDETSYVELKNTGDLDARFSISVFVWVYLDNIDGLIFKYGCSMRVSHSTLGIEVRYVHRKTSKIHQLHKENVLEANAWNFIGTTYDYHTGLATVWVNDSIVVLSSIGATMELATQSNVRVGASANQKTHFRGKISCLQFYDQALSVDQVIKIKARCNQTTPVTCTPNFFPFHGGCFSVNTKNFPNWRQALAQCNRKGGTLAKISREGLRYAFSNMLDGMRPKPMSLHIGLLTRYDWVWIDGIPLNGSLWMPGNPTAYKEIQSCGLLSASSSRIRNVNCGTTFSPLCQKKHVNSLSHRSLPQSSSVLLPYHPSLAIDRSYNTCFRSQKEANPWWQVTLEGALYVVSVEITDMIDCCPRDSGMISVTVSTSQTGFYPICTGSLQYGSTQDYKVHCSPPARGSYVTITLIGNNVTLVLYQVVIRTIESADDTHGVLREVWYDVRYDSTKSPTMRDNPAFKHAVESQIILTDFDAPANLDNNYIQRLTSYLQVPESGKYTFYVSCDDLCELWKHDVNVIEQKDKESVESVTKQPIVTVKRYTSYLQWNRYPEQMSQSIFLDKCRIYQIEAFMRERRGLDHISVGIRKPSGEYERPIPRTRLFWTKPGTRKLEATLQDRKTFLSAIVGSSVRISGFYRFCCEGVYCPDCPLELNISTLGQNVSVNSALNLSCVNTSFTTTFNTDRQPESFAIKISCSFVSNSEHTVYERVLGHVHLQAVVLRECYFESGYCGWTSLGDKDMWKLSVQRKLIKYPGHFAYIDDPYKAQMESNLLLWKPLYQSIGLCLRFKYLMPAKSKSTLKVFLRDSNLENQSLEWRLVGYHGEEWSEAQVALPDAKGFQIIFEGEGFLNDEMNVAVDDVILTTEKCYTRPFFAKPGFSCSDNQFTCKNGECVKKNLQCDGDFACKDNSDEDDCECSSTMFQCQEGGCVLATDMCDGTYDCSNGDDEKNCGNPCPSSHECLDGSCITWSKTCSQTSFCRDGTNTPSVCEYGKCHLNDLACLSKNSSENKRCRSFRGHCSFQNDNCGLKTDENTTFHWTVGSGYTPTENTGPSYDHTSFSKDGSYIFIEASHKNPGDKARLLSGWMEPNETVCVQFWYHMHGSDIGNLRIYLKTNQSERLVWRLSGDQGNRWKFGQMALNDPSLFRFTLEGTVGAGSKGDIALDDLSILDGFCEMIVKQASPDCNFEEDMCDWEAQDGWILDRHVKGFDQSDGFVAFLPAGASDLPSSLSSPVINTLAYEWKCLRFWHFIGSDHVHDWHTASLMVLIRKLTSNQTDLLFSVDEVIKRARYTQIPLPSHYTNSQIDFVGWSKSSNGPFIALDDVSFSKEPCQQIPWKPIEECQEAFGMKNGVISDGQITASSQFDANHAPFQGRLGFREIPRKMGSWSAARNDFNQWLQVDLGIQYAKVRRVATQGRNDAAQWVTKYKLQYGNDAVSFQYYREQGQVVNKTFNGNTDQDTVVYHELNPPIIARYIRFRPEAWRGWISMRVELYGCQEGSVDDCQEALGMENGAISDAQVTASSEYDARHAAIQGRLNFKAITWKAGSWSARRSDLHQWLQIDLGSQNSKVTRIATQGRNGHQQWVTRYKLQYSNDGVNFQYYREQGQTADKDFAGNTDQNTVVFHELNPPIRARCIRFRPQDWFSWISIRVELYGCRECQQALGMENVAIIDAQISASSQLDANYSAINARLHRDAGSWSAGSNDVNQWLQVDLGSQYSKVTRVATQGRNDAAQWVTKYKLQYSNDGVNFQHYQDEGKTIDKDFVGNTDSKTVVDHELIPPIRSRYIRFGPEAWHNHISMRVELYGCQDDRPCDISVDWCGWKSVRGWKRIKYKELDQDYQDYDGDDDGDERGGGGGSDGGSNYEIHLPDVDLGYVSFSDISRLHLGFTLCFWLKTEYSGFFIEYKVATGQNESLLLGVYCQNYTFRTQLGNEKSEVAMGVADDTWHHMCLSWEPDSGLQVVIKDGEIKSESNGIWSSSHHLETEGNGIMTIGFRVTNKNASFVLGKLSGFNVWSYALSAEAILRMSHGCGDEAGDVKAWETVRKSLQNEVAMKWFRTCNDRKGDRLVVDTSATGLYQSALLVSPPHNRSRDWHSKCLRFRFMLRGPGEKTLTIYQKSNNYREIPIWVSKRNTGSNWIYGQVALSSVSQFQVLLKGVTEKKEALIALTGLYIEEEKHCTLEPLLAKQACSENLFNTSGYFFSPLFPGYYFDDMFCTWHIAVQSRYIIHLEIQEFRLKDHPTCDSCFLQVFDGRDRTAPAIGKFCGYMYPPVFVSSSNHFTVVLYCHGNLQGARFKAFYHSVAAYHDTGSSCSHQEGCPSSCKCEEFGEDLNKRILVTGEDLLTVPSNLPSNTGAVFFQQNRISQLRENDFANLIKLEYIDMSFNILLHLDEDCFQNVTSVKTLRLNSNFFRTLPVGSFTGLPNLRVLDLGRNLLQKAVSGMFDGLSDLEVLSMRSNQLTELEYSSFDNQSNMTHLYLQDNKLSTLPDGLFGALSQLKVLNLSSNELKTVRKKTFQGLKSIEYLYLDRNNLYKIPSDTFSELTSLKYLKLDHFILCCYAKKSIVGVNCESPVDEFSSCDDLMKNKTLQICIWILGILASLGNILVIIWRLIDKEENRVHSFLLTNLAVADLLMGVYMLTIAIMDLKWQGEYFKHDIEWRSGMGCRIAGILSMLSSEVSVLILTIITLDRLISIVFPFKFKRLTYKAAIFACIGVWIFGVVISVIPITGIRYFFDESGNFGFYSRSAVCLPLQLSEGTSVAWEYSIAFFVGLNFISFMFILVAYIAMFWTVKRVSRAVRSTSLNKESAMAKRLVFIVMTDFCCWMPIIIINILSLTGNFKDPNKIAYVWIAVFVLPLNSSLNPILYTFSTERTKRSLTRKSKNATGLVMKTLKTSGSGKKRRPLQWRKASGENTVQSSVNVDSSLASISPAAGTQARDSKQGHAKLRLIEQVNILQDDTEGKRSTGYATAWCNEGTIGSMVLLKYFGKELKEEWNREADIMQGLSCGEDPHASLLRYRWYSKARGQSIEHGNVRIPELNSNSLLICYEFVSNSTLEDFLRENVTVLNFDAVCAIAYDVISAIERLQDLGILHNNITTKNILIGQCPRLPPIRAILGGFSRASTFNEAGSFTNLVVDEQSNCGNDIEQFGQLLATLLGHCHGSSEYVKLHEIMNLCFEETEEKRYGAFYIRELLEEAWSTEGVWNTYL